MLGVPYHCAVAESSASAQQARLTELAALLSSCRDIFQTMWNLKFHEPSQDAPSAAWENFQLIMTGPDGTVWPRDHNQQPRSVAVKLLHQQSDYCFSLGLLVGAGEVGDPASTLARSIVEYSVRGFGFSTPIRRWIAVAGALAR